MKKIIIITLISVRCSILFSIFRFLFPCRNAFWQPSPRDHPAPVDAALICRSKCECFFLRLKESNRIDFFLEKYEFFCNEEQVGFSDFRNVTVDSGIRGQKPSVFTLQLLARNLIALFSGAEGGSHEKMGNGEREYEQEAVFRILRK